jgi:hypothetical protein
MLSRGISQWILRLALAGAILYLAGTFGGRLLGRHPRDLAREQSQAQSNAAFLRTYGASDLRILQFYARDGVLLQGHSTVLCYGVLNATAVHIEPKVEGVSPALNRCLEVAPLHDTRYTLTAEAADGRTSSVSFQLAVVPDPATLPRITSFRIARQGIDRGRPYFVLSFNVENAEMVEVDPPVIPALHRAPLGQFEVAPDRSTTYTLTVTGKYGHKVSRQLKVTI